MLQHAVLRLHARLDFQQPGVRVGLPVCWLMSACSVVDADGQGLAASCSVLLTTVVFCKKQ
jgi:hypothetical protein